jgi:quinoprotein glucose dehydrogenase
LKGLVLKLAAVLCVALLLTACEPPAKAPSSDRYASWSSYAGTTDSAQFSSLTQINRENVDKLQVAWRFNTGETPHRCTPLVIGKVMYVVANEGVTALDAASGQKIWHAPGTAEQYLRGLVYWEDEAGANKRVVSVKDNALVALDPADGSVITSFGERGRIDLRKNLNRDPETIKRVATMTPGRVFEDLLIVGSAVGDETYEGAPGDIRAYNLLTGDLVWTFHTIPHPGEFGYDTWPEDAWMKIGAANAWSNIAIDKARGIAYVPTGAPSYHFYGGNRVGDNLFANTLLALDARTGERIWHFQAVHHDIWDYDLAMGPKLLTVQHEGTRVDAVALAGKQGLLFVFDRETGEPLFPIEERAVPASDVPGEVASPTQPWPVKLQPFARISLSADELSPYADEDERQALAAKIRAARNDGLYTPPSLRGSVSAPGSRGGAQFGNGAVIPEEGLFFHAVIESPTIPRLEERGTFDKEHFLSARPAEIYASTCAVCHGASGAGQPPLFPALVDVTQRMDTEQFAQVLRQGRGRMAAYPDIPDEQIEPLMQYVDQLNDESVSPLPVPASVSDAERPYRSGYHHFFSDNGLVGPPPWSKLMGWDLNTGEVLWEKPYGDVITLKARGITGTGSLFPTNSLAASAGGLLFSVTNDRQIRAWNQADGEVLGQHELLADPGGIPAIYEIEGRQFVVAAATRGDRTAYGLEGRYEYIAFTLPDAVSPVE